MIELKRLKLINWHNFENVTFDCARLTYMIGVNAVGKTTILDAIRYCLTTNRNFNALGNKKSGRTLQGSVHAKQRGENAYRRRKLRYCFQFRHITEYHHIYKQPEFKIHRC